MERVESQWSEQRCAMMWCFANMCHDEMCLIGCVVIVHNEQLDVSWRYATMRCVAKSWRYFPKICNVSRSAMPIHLPQTVNCNAYYTKVPTLIKNCPQIVTGLILKSQCWYWDANVPVPALGIPVPALGQWLFRAQHIQLLPVCALWVCLNKRVAYRWQLSYALHDLPTLWRWGN